MSHAISVLALALPASWWVWTHSDSLRVLALVALAAALARAVRHFARSQRRNARPAVTLCPLPGLGVEVLGVSAAAISEVAAGSPLVRELAAALEVHAVLLLRAAGGGSPSLSPKQLRELYSKIHAARFKQLPVCAPPAKAPSPSGDGNLRGQCFPGFPETNVLGFAASVKDWHGLTGWLQPTAWWERASGQFHHDGGFSASAAPPPALVSLYCEEAPSCRGSPTRLEWGSAEAQLDCPRGATIFYSTRRALQIAPADVAARARRLRCCYKEGFGRIRVGEYPRMSKTLLTPLSPPSEIDEAHGGHQSITAFESFETLSFGAGSCEDTAELYRHLLVQRDTLGREFVVVHSVCLDHLEELSNGQWRPLSWAASQEIIETLLAPATRPPYLLVLDWRPGDVVLFDNLQTQHSVTPSDAYTISGQRRLMTRTAMQPGCKILA